MVFPLPCKSRGLFITDLMNEKAKEGLFKYLDHLKNKSMENGVFPFQTKKLNKIGRRDFYLALAERCFHNWKINTYQHAIHSESIILNKTIFKEIEIFMESPGINEAMNFSMTAPDKVEMVMIGFLLLYAETFEF